MRIVYVDFDGTLVSTNMVHYLLHACVLALGTTRRVGFALRAASVVACLPILGLLDLCGARARDALFHTLYRGLSASEFRRLLDRYWEAQAARCTRPEVLDRVRSLAAQGYVPVIVSGSARPVVEAWRTGHPLFQAALCTELEVDRDGRFTGRAAGPILVEEAKVAAIRDYERDNALSVVERICIGDSIQDIPMLNQATRAIAANPSPALAREARRRSWEVLRGSHA